MTGAALPPLISSDGHLEVRPERWTPRMPARYRERAPRTVKLRDGGDAILVESQPPYPAPFLDLRAGRTSETWQPFGATVDDAAGVEPPEQRLREQDVDGLLAEVLFPNMQVGPRLWRGIADDDLYRATVRAYDDWLATDFPHIECDWPNTRPFAERLLAGVPADEAFRIASGNVLDFFHLRDTPVRRKALAAAA
jgi:hypothetical protein